MTKKGTLWVSLALSFLVAGLLASRPATAQDSAAMAVDAIAGGAVDSARTVAGAGTFDIDIVVTSTPGAYAGYQYTLEWDPSILAYDAATDLRPGEMYNCATPSQQTLDSLFGGCLRSSGTTTYTGPVTTVTLHCVGDGVSPLHLVTLAEDPNFGTTTIGPGGALLATNVADAQVTCGEGGAPPPTPGASPTPGGPAPTATPLPPGMEAVDLMAGCNPVASTYPDATPTQTIASNVGRTGILASVWKFDLGTWLGYSPQFPEVSDLTETEFLDALFICVDSPGAFVRPIV